MAPARRGAGSRVGHHFTAPWAVFRRPLAAGGKCGQGSERVMGRKHLLGSPRHDAFPFLVVEAQFIKDGEVGLDVVGLA